MRVGKWNGRARPTPGVMNKSEAAYAEHLRVLQLAGEVSDFMFEPLKLKLADKTYYSPDFMVVMPDGLIEFAEVKGHWEDDARVKIKCAAAKFGLFRFVAVTAIAKKHGGGWEREEF